MFKEGCPGSLEIRQPKPEDIRCQKCGEKIEIWTDEPETACKKCGHPHFAFHSCNHKACPQCGRAATAYGG